MVVNDNSEETAGNGKQHKASVLLTPTLSHQSFNNEIKKEDFVGKNYRINDNVKSVTTPPTPPPKNDFWEIHDTLEIKNKQNKRKTGIPHSLDLPPTPTFTPSSHSDDNSPTSSPCLSSYFNIYQTFNSCSS